MSSKWDWLIIGPLLLSLCLFLGWSLGYFYINNNHSQRPESNNTQVEEKLSNAASASVYSYKSRGGKLNNKHIKQSKDWAQKNNIGRKSQSAAFSGGEL